MFFSGIIISLPPLPLAPKSIHIFLTRERALAGVAQLIERWPANQRVVGLIPSQDTCLGCGPGPQLGARERQLIDVSHIGVSFPRFFPTLSLSLLLFLQINE